MLWIFSFFFLEIMFSEIFHIFSKAHSGLAYFWCIFAQFISTRWLFSLLLCEKFALFGDATERQSARKKESLFSCCKWVYLVYSFPCVLFFNSKTDVSKRKQLYHFYLWSFQHKSNIKGTAKQRLAFFFGRMYFVFHQFIVAIPVVSLFSSSYMKYFCRLNYDG